MTTGSFFFLRLCSKWTSKSLYLDSSVGGMGNFPCFTPGLLFYTKISESYPAWVSDIKTQILVSYVLDWVTLGWLRHFSESQFPVSFACKLVITPTARELEETLWMTSTKLLLLNCVTSGKLLHFLAFLPYL